MNRDWKPGDVGVSGSDERFIVTTKGECFWPGETGRSWSGVSGVPNETDRPLVVIDPENAEQVERFTDTWVHANAGHDLGNAYPGEVEHMQAALRAFADPTPHIEEPTGRYAVVVSATGEEWIKDGLTKDGICTGQWWCVTRARQTSPDSWRGSWSDVNAVRVLSEGVTSC